MVTFDAPIERCPICKEYIMMDQTWDECAREHGCTKVEECPLARYFTGAKYKADQYDSVNHQI